MLAGLLSVQPFKLAPPPVRGLFLWDGGATKFSTYRPLETGTGISKPTAASPYGDMALGKDTFDIDRRLHPSKAFATPLDVVKDPDLATNEKRAILSSWASKVAKSAGN